jgi:hypothetical protein
MKLKNMLGTAFGHLNQISRKGDGTGGKILVEAKRERGERERERERSNVMALTKS